MNNYMPTRDSGGYKNSFHIYGNEAGRIAALKFYEILDAPPEDAFDLITRIATAYLDVPTLDASTDRKDNA